MNIYAIDDFAMRSIITIFKKIKDAKKIKNNIIETRILKKIQNQDQIAKISKSI